MLIHQFLLLNRSIESEFMKNNFKNESYNILICYNKNSDLKFYQIFYCELLNCANLYVRKINKFSI